MHGWKQRHLGWRLLAGLKSRCVPVAAVHALGAHHHGCGALILLRVTLLPHAEGLHREPVLLHLHHNNDSRDTCVEHHSIEFIFILSLYVALYVYNLFTNLLL